MDRELPEGCTGWICVDCNRFYPEGGSLDLSSIDQDLTYDVMFRVGCDNCQRKVN